MEKVFDGDDSKGCTTKINFNGNLKTFSKDKLKGKATFFGKGAVH
jgi:hypothetical protein